MRDTRINIFGNADRGSQRFAKPKRGYHFLLSKEPKFTKKDFNDGKNFKQIGWVEGISKPKNPPHNDHNENRPESQELDRVEARLDSFQKDLLSELQVINAKAAKLRQ